MANPHVRANAVTLMLDAFPLVEPGVCQQEVDLQLQRQFDLIRVGFFNEGISLLPSLLQKTGVMHLVSCRSY